MRAVGRSTLLALLVAACGEAAPTPFSVSPPPPRRLVADRHGVCAVTEHGVICSDDRRVPGAGGWRAAALDGDEPCGVNGVGDLECGRRAHSGARVASLVSMGNGVAYIDEAGAVWRFARTDDAPAGTPHLAGSIMLGAPYGWICALSSGGRVACLRDDDLTVPPVELALGEIERISTGWPFCVVRHGALSCERHVLDAEPSIDDLEAVPGLTGVVDVVSSGGTVTAMTGPGAVHSFAMPAPDAPWDAGPAILDDAVELAEAHGDLHCARRRGGEIVCWGTLADARRFPRRPPTPIPGVAGAVDVALDSTHACIAVDDGSVLCWGGLGAAAISRTDAIGSLGLPEHFLADPSEAFPPESRAPTPIDLGIAGVVEIELLDDALYGRSADGAVGSSTARGEHGWPAWIPEGARVAELEGPCARTESGDVYCRGVAGETPVLRRTTSIATYYQQVCGVRGRLVACTSMSDAPTADPFDAPARVRQRFTPSALGPATRLVGGPTSICGRGPSGAWRCIGHNGVGQLGTTPSRPTIAPVDFAGGPWDELVLGVHRSCVWRAGEALTCAGVDEDGEPRSEEHRGDGSLTSLPITGVRAFALSEHGAIVILEDGTAVSFGREGWGELGGGRSRWLPEPTPFVLSEP